MMQPIHLRMARAALGWTLKDLADRADVNLNTISRYEAGKEVLSGTIQRIEEVLLREGVVFIDERDDIGFGVILKSRQEHQRTHHDTWRERVIPSPTEMEDFAAVHEDPPFVFERYQPKSNLGRKRRISKTKPK